MKILFTMLLLFSCTTSIAQGNEEPITGNERIRMVDLIESAKSCDSDSDCQIVDVGCPFGCGVAVNSQRAKHVLDEVNKYQIRYGNCDYFCLIFDQPQCIESTCVAMLKHITIRPNLPATQAGSP